MKTKIIIILSLIFGILISISCNSVKGNEEEHSGHEEHKEHKSEGTVYLNEAQREALNLKLGSFEMRNLTTVVKVNGQLTVSPSDIAEVTAVIGGNVKYIKVFQGDKVRKGQTLAVLEHPDYIKLQEDFAEKANKLNFLEQEYKRQKELYENNVGAGKDYQKAKADYNTAKAKYEGLKARLKMLNISPDNVLRGNISSAVNILSPINGYVNEIFIKRGTYAGAQTKLFEITNNNAIHADLTVYEKDVHLVKKGQKVHFTVSNRPDEELTATVFAVGKEFNPDIRAVNIHAKIDGNISGLIPGMYISGHLHTDKHLVKTLPEDAVVTEGIKSYIFILDENQLAETHSHEIEHENEDKHNHEKEHEHSNEDKPENIMSFKMTEVITGQKDDGFIEIKPINPIPENAKIVLNAAYYLLADMKKEENEHTH